MKFKEIREDTWVSLPIWFEFELSSDTTYTNTWSSKHWLPKWAKIKIVSIHETHNWMKSILINVKTKNHEEYVSISLYVFNQSPLYNFIKDNFAWNNSLSIITDFYEQSIMIFYELLKIIELNLKFPQN